MLRKLHAGVLSVYKISEGKEEKHPVHGNNMLKQKGKF